jgi:hypothetical protein
MAHKVRFTVWLVLRGKLLAHAQSSAMFVSLNVLGSVVLDFSPGRLDFKFVNSSAAVQDYFTLLKTASSPRIPRQVCNATAVTRRWG